MKQKIAEITLYFWFILLALLVSIPMAFMLPVVLLEPSNGTSGRAGAATMGCVGWILMVIVGLIIYLLC